MIMFLCTTLYLIRLQSRISDFIQLVFQGQSNDGIECIIAIKVYILIRPKKI